MYSSFTLVLFSLHTVSPEIANSLILAFVLAPFNACGKAALLAMRIPLYNF